jgi:two-component system, response regulator PdtaR
MPRPLGRVDITSTSSVRLLPGDGLKAVQAICGSRKVPVVFITGYADELIDRAPDAIVVQKPIDEEELREAVRQASARERERS